MCRRMVKAGTRTGSEWRDKSKLTVNKGKELDGTEERLRVRALDTEIEYRVYRVESNS